MTIDEAIKHWEDISNGITCENDKVCGKDPKQLVEWLEELKRMRAKFLTKKTVEGLEYDDPECPNCREDLDKWDQNDYCHSCGQALSWDYVEEEDEQ